MGTATAPLHGPSRYERVLSTPRRIGAFVSRAFTLNIGGARGSAERRGFKRFAIGIPLANMCGAIDVFLFLWFVAPLPELTDRGQAQAVNGVAFAVAMVVTFVICGSLCNKCADPIARWLDSGEPADEDMVHRVLRFPFTQTLLSMYAWVASAFAFGILDATFSPQL